MEYRLSEIVGAGFGESHLAVKEGITELVEQGGRGSGKSSFLSIELLLQLIRHPQCHAVVVRKVASTLRASVYAQILWAISALGLGSRFRCTLSPLECEYLPTGQKILFFGMDDPGKLKSIKVPKGYIGICWFEELDQFEAEEVRSVEQSVFRGGEFSLCLKSFNPPPSPGHWVNCLQDKPGRRIHHSTYLELPEKWLGKRFLADAEHLKQVNDTVYRNEYLGQCVGLGAEVFTNVQLRQLSDREIQQFDRTVCGVDWGWWPDPWAFNRMHYDAARRVLYIFDELTRHRCGNRETGALVLERIPRGELVIADSAEEKSIADYRQLGIHCRGAQKGPGSVAYSMKWLQALAAIVIDPVRCPDTAREFTRYAYERDRGGAVVAGFPDRENHHIDAVRYGMSRVWRRDGNGFRLAKSRASPGCSLDSACGR